MVSSRLIERALVGDILHRATRPPVLIQIITGPRQVGKTTAARQAMTKWEGPSVYAAADAPLPQGPGWIRTHWQQARKKARSAPCLLVLDEVQKVQGWSETVKALWDEDRRENHAIRPLLLGSSALLIARGTVESLAGRFYLHRCNHWSLEECQRAFGWDLDQWIYFGGYPGAAPLADEGEEAWRSYVRDSLVEAVLARDVLAMHSVSKPALLRNLFLLAAHFPAQVLSYNKMLGQLQDAGNTTTLSHYLRLLETAFLISGLQRYSPGHARSRASSPKLVLWNNALVNALDTRSFDAARADTTWWGRLVENAAGAHLVNGLPPAAYEICYWRERNNEVDFVVRAGERVWALEIKSGRDHRTGGLDAFRRKWPRAQPMLVGEAGLGLEEFFSTSPTELFE